MKKGNFKIEKEDAFVALPTTEDELIFAIAVRENEPNQPKLLYDGDEHALLIRSKEDAVILDYLNSEVQKILQHSFKIYVAEIDYKEKKMMRDYMVPIHLVDSYPFNLAPFFD